MTLPETSCDITTSSILTTLAMDVSRQSTNMGTANYDTTTIPKINSSTKLPFIADDGTSTPQKSYWELLTRSNEATTHQQTATATELLTTSEDKTKRTQTGTSDDIETIAIDQRSQITSDITKTTNQTPATSTGLLSLSSNKAVTPKGTISNMEPCASSCTMTYTCNCPLGPTTSTSYMPVDLNKIDKKTLSSYRRRHMSASDPRKSSFYIGMVGVAVLAGTVAFIVILDFLPRALL